MAKNRLSRKRARARRRARAKYLRSRRRRKSRVSARFAPQDIRRTKSIAKQHILAQPQQTLKAVVIPYPSTKLLKDPLGTEDYFIPNSTRTSSRIFLKGVRMSGDIYNLGNKPVMINMAVVQKKEDEITEASFKREFFRQDLEGATKSENFVDWADSGGNVFKNYYKYAKINPDEFYVIKRWKFQLHPRFNSATIDGEVASGPTELVMQKEAVNMKGARWIKPLKWYLPVKKWVNFDQYNLTYPLHAIFVVWWATCLTVDSSISLQATDVCNANFRLTTFYLG